MGLGFNGLDRLQPRPPARTPPTLPEELVTDHVKKQDCKNRRVMTFIWSARGQLKRGRYIQTHYRRRFFISTVNNQNCKGFTWICFALICDVVVFFFHSGTWL